MAKSAKIVPFRYAPRPIVIRSTKVVKSKKTKHHHRHAGAAGLFSGNRGKILMGAFAVGLLQKSGIANNLPKIPLLGETGTVGLAAHFMSGGRAGLLQDIATAALTIAAYELGSTGSITGVAGETPDVSGYVAGF